MSPNPEINEQHFQDLGRMLSTEMLGTSPAAAEINILRSDYSSRLSAALSSPNGMRPQLSVLMGSVESVHNTSGDQEVIRWTNRVLNSLRGVLNQSPAPNTPAPTTTTPTPAPTPEQTPTTPAPVPAVPAAATAGGATVGQTASTQAGPQKRSAWRIVTTPINYLVVQPINYAVVKPVKLATKVALYPFKILGKIGGWILKKGKERSKVFG